jgi:hypothetical protein
MFSKTNGFSHGGKKKIIKHLPRKDTEFHAKSRSRYTEKAKAAEAFATEGHGISRK